VECGLISNALICERAALEDLAFDFVLRINPEYAKKYNDNKIPEPREVRQELENNGLFDDSRHIKELYSKLSRMTHTSRNDNDLISTKIKENSWELHIGGKYSLEDTNHMLEILPSLVFWFIKEK
jgi:hypothetical protein